MATKTTTNPHRTVRSFRASDAVWKTAQARAHGEGRSMSNVLLLLLEGYAHGTIDTPKVRATLDDEQ